MDTISPSLSLASRTASQTVLNVRTLSVYSPPSPDDFLEEYDLFEHVSYDTNKIRDMTYERFNAMLESEKQNIFRHINHYIEHGSQVLINAIIPHIPPDKKNNAFEHALVLKKTDVITIFLKHYQDIGQALPVITNAGRLINLIRSGGVNMLKTLESYGVSYDLCMALRITYYIAHETIGPCDGMPPDIDAAYQDIVQHLLAKDVDLNRTLCEADDSSYEFTYFMLKLGADASKGGWPLLQKAICRDNPRTVELLFEHGVAVDLENNLPIKCAIYNNNANIVSLLIKHGASLDWAHTLPVPSPKKCGYRIMEILMDCGLSPLAIMNAMDTNPYDKGA